MYRTLPLLAYLCWHGAAAAGDVLGFFPGSADDGVASHVLGQWHRRGDVDMTEDGFLRLTRDAADAHGTIMRDVQLSAADGWEAFIVLRVSGVGVSLVGDGVAVLLTQAQLEQGPLFGVAATYSGVGIFIDTREHPTDQSARPGSARVIGVVNDGTMVVDQGAYFSTLHAPSSCSLSRARWTTGAAPDEQVAVVLRVSARAGDARVNVHATTQELSRMEELSSSSSWQECFTLPFAFAAQTSEWVLTVSASTGRASDAHDVLALALATRDARATADSRWAASMHYISSKYKASEGHRAWIAPPRPMEAARAPPNDADLPALCEAYTAAERQRVAAAIAQVEGLEASTKSRVAAIHTRMEEIIDGLQKADASAEAKLTAIEESIRAHLHELRTLQASSTRGMTIALVALSVLVIALAALAWRHYVQIRKLHTA